MNWECGEEAVSAIRDLPIVDKFSTQYFKVLIFSTPLRRIWKFAVFPIWRMIRRTVCLYEEKQGEQLGRWQVLFYAGLNSESASKQLHGGTITCHIGIGKMSVERETWLGSLEGRY
jgi:hypothetical protein